MSANKQDDSGGVGSGPRFLLTLIVLSAALFCARARAQDGVLGTLLGNETVQGQSKTEEKPQELDIKAETIEWQLEERIGILQDNVIVTDKTMTLTSDRMVVHMNTKNELKLVEATGNVIIRENGTQNRAIGGKAVFDVAKDTITLSDSPSLFQGDKAELNADTVVYDRGKRRFLFTGKEAAHLIINLASDKAEDPLKVLGTKREDDKKGKDEGGK